MPKVAEQCERVPVQGDLIESATSYHYAATQLARIMVLRSIAAAAQAAASTAAAPSPSTTSAAAQTIQRRAIQCSFSSVFHLRNAGAGRKEAQEAERIFFNAVAVPMGIMGAVGGAAFLHKSFFADEAQRR